MKILLTGSSGFIGSHITTALELAGHELIIASRSRGMDFNHLLKADDWLPYLQGVQVVINSVGIIAETRGQTFNILHTQAPVALFHACVEVGVERVVQISSLGADDEAFTPYQLSKKSADDLLRSLPLEWFVLRPSLVYGTGGKSTALFKQMANLPLIPVVEQGTQLIQPVHITDLVDAVLACIDATSTRRTIDIVGPRVISFSGWLQRLRLKAGKNTANTLSVPFKLMLVLSYLGHFVVPLLHPDNLRMLQQGNTADVQQLSELLGRMPHDLP
ncbi:MAG: NAD-dependent epimerase/dehydratase family protein [Sulfuriflexus sp.]|nr:NAD-dependent epimerase/dehydratase family protein [Sulfuriflexus sp.]